MFLVGAIGILISIYVREVVPFNLLMSLSCAWFLSIGLLVKMYHFHTNNLLSLFSIIVFSILSYIEIGGRMDLSQNIISDNGNVLVNLLVSLLGVLFVYELSNILNQWRIKRYLVWLGSNTLPIVGFDYFSNVVASEVIKLTMSEQTWIAFFMVKLLLLSLFIFLITNFFPRFNAIIQGRY